MDNLFIQYTKLCAENIVSLPELEEAISDKNVLVPAVRESLKQVDNLLRGLKSVKSDELKTIEKKAASIKIDLESVSDKCVKN